MRDMYMTEMRQGCQRSVTMSGATCVLFAALVSLLSLRVSAGLYEYYQPPSRQHARNDAGIDDSGYTLYLKPVLVRKSATPVEMMYLAVDDKDVLLVPASLHYLPYPLQYNKNQQQSDERLQHHVESPSEYGSEDEHYSGSEHSQSTAPKTNVANSTQYDESSSETRIATISRIPAKQSKT